MAWEGQCGNCTSYDFQGDNYKGYCSTRRCYYYPGDTCQYQVDRGSASSCYITTIICDILGFDDDCGVLNTLRDFRKDVLQKDEKYKDLLFEYDVVGPTIADLISLEFKKEQDKEMWTQIYNFYLSPTANFILEKNYDFAIMRYKEMVNSLKDYYGINVEIHPDEDYDYTNGGHGKVKTK